jgi:hypothetical protein
MSSLLRSIGAGELALRLVAHRGHGDWSALVVSAASGDDVEQAAAELVDEMKALGGAQTGRIRAPGGAVALVDELAKIDGPAVVTGLDGWTEAEWQHLDELRSRLLREERTVLVLSSEAFERLVATAPNLGSFIPSAWRYLPDADRITEEERERRLGALRAWSGMTDEQMLERRRTGVLPPDPEFSLWLILLDRGDLLAGGHP